MYRTPEVAALSGATYRQLDYWERTGTLVADEPARGSGSQRAYSHRQVLVARALTVLAAHGATRNVLWYVARVLCDLPTFGGRIHVDVDGRVRHARDAHHDGWLLDLDRARAYVDEAERLTARSAS